MFKKSLFILIALALSSGISFLVGEAGFWALLFSQGQFFQKFRDPSLYADFLSDDDYGKLYYRFGGKYKPPKHPHPLLGWVDLFEGNSYRHNATDEVGNRRPVLLYGDSFARCSGGKFGDKCYQFILNYDKSSGADFFLLNYAVGGYGFDQIFLLFKNSIDNYSNPLVVLSLMTQDLDRSILSVKTAQKPFFEISEDQLVLKGTPIDPNPARFYAEHPPDVTSYLYRLWLYQDGRPWRLRQMLRGTEEKKRKKLQINEKIFLGIIEELKRRRLPHVFLIYHRKNEVNMKESNWRDKFIKRNLRQQNVPFISSKEVILRDFKEHNKNLDDYFIPDDGHPSTYQHQLLAEKIKEWVMRVSSPSKFWSATEGWIMLVSSQRLPLWII